MKTDGGSEERAPAQERAKEQALGDDGWGGRIGAVTASGILPHAAALAELTEACEEARAFAWLVPAASARSLAGIVRWAQEPTPLPEHPGRRAAYGDAYAGHEEARQASSDAGQGADRGSGLAHARGAHLRWTAATAVLSLASASGQLQAGDEANRAEGLRMIARARVLLTEASAKLAAWPRGPIVLPAAAEALGVPLEEA